MSRYPLAAVTSGSLGLGVGVDMDRPAQYRLSYHAGTRQLVVAYDFGLLSDPGPGSGQGSFRFVLFRFDGRDGFRGALAAYYRIFPDRFTTRCREAGTWLPFRRPEEIHGWEDFGFAFHERADGGGAATPGLLSFRYTEPGALWMPMPPGAPRREEEARRILEEGPPGPARAVGASGVIGSDGRTALKFKSTPWCDGAVWSLNPNPRVAGDPNAASLAWNSTVRARHYGGEAPVPFDGEFVDSIEGYATAELDFSRAHLRASTAAPSFASDTGRPVLFKGLTMFEYVRDVAVELRRTDRLLFGNGGPHRFAFLAPWLDVAGTEVGWLADGTFRWPADADVSFWRAMSFQKPCVVLLNADFTELTPWILERYFQCCLFYGLFPGLFSANAQDHSYWSNPGWYERDRDLFRKYIPLLRRTARAGWQPTPRARCSNPDLWIERYGPDAAGVTFFTLLNATGLSQQGTLVLPSSFLRGRACRELISGRALQPEGCRIEAALPPGTAWLIEVSPR
jgi:hypothetical protein